MSGRWRIEVAAGEGERLDRFLADRAGLGLSRSRARELIEAGLVLVDGSPAKPSLRLRQGALVEVSIPEPEPLAAVPEPLPLSILYEDEDLVVVNKPRGLVVHPAPGHARGTLVNALLAHCGDLQGIGDRLRPGIVHRLDKDTTGLIVVAKNENSFASLARQVRQRTMVREYLALVHGQPPDEGMVDAPIGRHPVHRQRMAIVAPPRGRPAVTFFKTLERFPARGEAARLAVTGCGRGGGYSLLLARLATGRTHQIRVHMAHIGFPVAGDPTYGPKANPLGLGGQALHAWRLTLMHPRTGATMTWEAPLPDDLARAVARLRSLNKERGARDLAGQDHPIVIEGLR